MTRAKLDAKKTTALKSTPAPKPPRTASQIGKANRRKGKAYEREVANELKEAIGDESIRRGLQTRGGGEASDVITEDYFIEAKSRLQINVFAVLKEAEDDYAKATASFKAKKGQTVIAVCKRPQEKSIVVMRLTDFAAMAAELHQSRSVKPNEHQEAITIPV